MSNSLAAAQVVIEKIFSVDYPIAVFKGKRRIVEFCNPASENFSLRSKRDAANLIGVYDAFVKIPDLIEDLEAAGIV